MLQAGHDRPRAAHAPAGLERAELIRPKTVNAACSALAEASAKKRAVMVLAGGTDVIVDRHLLPVERAHEVELVVDVTAVEGFRTIETRSLAGDERLVLGGGVTYWDLRKSALIARTVPMLADMSKDVGAVQIQTRGTLAGNIASASPAADGVAALMALDARVHLESTDGTRQVPLESFFSAYRKTVMRPEELIVAMDLRVPLSTASVLWRKVGTRQAQSISKVALASVIEVESGVFRHTRFGMASVAACTHPLAAVRAHLEGRAVTALVAAELDTAISRDIKPIDDVRSTGEYRLHIARSLVRRALEDATHGAFRAPLSLGGTP